MLKTPNLQNKFDICLQIVSVHHTISCSNRGIFITRHNEIRYKIIHLLIQTFYPNFVCGEHLIPQGLSVSEVDVRHDRIISASWDDVSIRGL